MLERTRLPRDRSSRTVRAAVQQAQQRRFDAILMDCQMPGMDGYAATARHSPRRERARHTADADRRAHRQRPRERPHALHRGRHGPLPGQAFHAQPAARVLQPIAEQRGTFVAAQSTPARRAGSRTGSAIAPAAGRATPGPGALPQPLWHRPTTTARCSRTRSSSTCSRYRPPTLPPLLTPVLDAEQVAAIRGLGKPKVFEHLCDLLFTGAPATLKALRRRAGDRAISRRWARPPTHSSLPSATSADVGSPSSSSAARRQRATRATSRPRAAPARGLKRTYADLEEALEGRDPAQHGYLRISMTNADSPRRRS